MKKIVAIAILYLATLCMPRANAQPYSQAFNALDVTAQQTSGASDLEPERNKKTKRQGALKIRHRVFTVHLFRFNKKIRANYDKEKKSLERYEDRLKRKQARKDKRKSDFKYHIKRRGPSVRQRKIME